MHNKPHGLNVHSVTQLAAIKLEYRLKQKPLLTCFKAITGLKECSECI